MEPIWQVSGHNRGFEPAAWSSGVAAAAVWVQGPSRQSAQDPTRHQVQGVYRKTISQHHSLNFMHQVHDSNGAYKYRRRTSAHNQAPLSAAERGPRLLTSAGTDLVLRASLRGSSQTDDEDRQCTLGTWENKTYRNPANRAQQRPALSRVKILVHAQASKGLEMIPYHFTGKAFSHWAMLLIAAPEESPNSGVDMKEMLLTRFRELESEQELALAWYVNTTESNRRWALPSSGIWAGGPQRASATAWDETGMGLTVVAATGGQGPNQGTQGMRQGHLDRVRGGHPTAWMGDLDNPSSGEITVLLVVNRIASFVMIKTIWLRLAPGPKRDRAQRQQMPSMWGGRALGQLVLYADKSELEGEQGKNRNGATEGASTGKRQGLRVGGRRPLGINRMTASQRSWVVMRASQKTHRRKQQASPLE
ncbi:hypothetical protein Efla_000523 [Eimeria flavescens]